MKIITYLFGAGASCNVMPLVRDIPEKLSSFIDVLEKPENKLSEDKFNNRVTLKFSLYDYELALIDDYKWLLKSSKEHASIDTYAKKLLIQNKPKDIRRLKIALSIFFEWLQYGKNADTRYDSFFASIMDMNMKFPENIKLLSWNYDAQFEIALMPYSGDDNISSSRRLLNLSAKNQPVDYYTNEQFFVYKIKSSCDINNVRSLSNWALLNIDNKSSEFKIINNLVESYSLISKNNDYQPALSFAWEPEYVKEGIRNDFIENVSNTEILVVIGYSFPFFNRETDRKIIQSMAKLEKIYIQDLKPRAVANSFKAIRNDLDSSQIELINTVDQFFMPYEM